MCLTCLKAQEKFVQMTINWYIIRNWIFVITIKDNRAIKYAMYML